MSHVLSSSPSCCRWVWTRGERRSAAAPRYTVWPRRGERSWWRCWRGAGPTWTLAAGTGPPACTWPRRPATRTRRGPCSLSERYPTRPIPSAARRSTWRPPTETATWWTRSCAVRARRLEQILGTCPNEKILLITV